MATFSDKIKLDNFSVDNIDLSEVDELSKWLPSNGVMDINIAEKGLVITLHAQNICQEKITKLDRWISVKEGEKNKAWTKAALDKATTAGYKTVKNREWFAQADDEYIEACNQVAIAKAAKKWLENKASYFSGWHYTFKTFLRRDYGLEKLGNFQGMGYNDSSNFSTGHKSNDNNVENTSGEINWKE